MDISKLNGLQNIMNEMVEFQYVAGINCLVMQKGKEIAYYEAGYADIKNQKPIKRDTIFLLYSMSKPLTAAAAMVLMERGVIDLLDPIEKFIPAFRGQQVLVNGSLVSAERPVTIKDLLSMTSGILYGNDINHTGIKTEALFEEIRTKLLSDEPITTKEFAKRIAKIPLAFQPGSKWEYGAGADVLGAVIEAVANRPLGEFLEENLFRPLEMVDTGFYVPDEKQSRLSKVYEDTNKGLIEYDGNHLGILINFYFCIFYDLFIYFKRFL